ncbi:DivIVA domain-containing protein [Gordonia sp. CPCC 205333]|uniref:DivIVA domain-containing protein n=1 Tax=Gordonia sp. CPCC 205333 TaxID=3140790 RepID=UPI003AF3919D
MTTLLLYLLIMAVVVSALFVVVWFVFGRAEDLPPLEPGTTLTRLPRDSITGDDVRAVRFRLVLRGYRQTEVDWTLEKLARELDELRALTQTLQARDGVDATLARAPGAPSTRAEDDRN